METMVAESTPIVQKTEGTVEHIKLNYIAAKTAAKALRAVGHKLRQQMLKLLEENKRMCVTDIYVKLRMEQSVASQHLAILRNAKVVINERNGKTIFYSLNYARLEEIAIFCNKMTLVPENNN